MPQGKLEVIGGPMFSGKSEELIRRLKRHQIGQRRVVAIKPMIDNRYSSTDITSHSGHTFKCFTLNYPIPHEVEIAINTADVIGVDEAQFFEEHWIVAHVNQLVASGKIVIVAGLDRTYRGEPFGPMAQLLGYADEVVKLAAVCHSCGGEAHLTQRLINGEPAPFDGPTVQVGGLDTYEARCRDCFEKA